jgi:putative membrane protein
MSEIVTATYCGPAAMPGELAQRWNLDPLVVLALGCIALLHAFGAQRGAHGPTVRDHLLFGAGWLAAGIIVLSPLCALGVALFSARVGGHVLLALVAAPLLVAGGRRSVRRALPRLGFLASLLPRDRSCAARSIVFAVVFWGWHSPGAYAATFASDAVYWSMQLSLLASALWLWSGLLRAGADGRIASLAGAAATMGQLGLLGALLTFATEPLYAHHLATAPAWGLSALQDQQLGGLICWVPGCAVLLCSVLASTASWLLRDGIEGAR